MRYCGRDFSATDLFCIRELIAAHPTATRALLSRLVCEQLDWRRGDGRLKDMSCRVAMLRMQDAGLLELPPPRNGNNNGKPYLRRTLLGEPGPLLEAASPKRLGDLRLQLVTDRHDSHLHNELLQRYHYLGYQPLPGAQLRYFARAEGRIIALLGFGAAAWKTAPRDSFIGWTTPQREARLHLVVNNARFLILPWVRCKNLASCILGMATRDSPETGSSTTATAPSCWRPSSRPPAFEAPATGPPTGSSSARPRGEGSSMSTTEPPCPRRPSGSIHSGRTSEPHSAKSRSQAQTEPANWPRTMPWSACPGLLRS